MVDGGFGMIGLTQAIVGAFLLIGAESPESQARAWGESLFEARIERLSVEESPSNPGQFQLMVETKLDSRCYELSSSLLDRSRQQNVLLVYLEAKSRPDAAFDCELGAQKAEFPLTKSFELGNLKSGPYQVLNYKTLKRLGSVEIKALPQLEAKTAVSSKNSKDSL